MKKIILYTSLAAIICITGCKKLNVDEPEFDVSLSKTTYKVGEAVNFTFAGNPDLITVYRGIPGENYDFRNRIDANGIPQLNFTTLIQNPGELNTLRLKASTDFAGKYDATGIASATWTDITSRAILSTGTDNTASGTIDLSDLKVAGKPLYLAYTYSGYAHATLKQPSWFIRTFNVNNVLPDGRTSLISAIGQVGWIGVDVKNPTVVWAVPTTGQAAINGTDPAAINQDNEDWLISKPFNLNAVSADIGLGLKTSTTTLNSYNYVYTTAGSYTITFIAANASRDDKKEIVKQLTITIEP
ncbi:DUF5017 domain-containing protein [Pedobacter mucosus]|uniref:DUF5017 domain-containing protein n=1 Tax=Pedobacter mucosus TaxID=2895286 RepID=UPI001EE3AE27|nr:DUF5017 domain-containing protein [Pedobacter mucosus]UKT64926.1 DUF5017 domain-containing protein [Pedobacter mucosus]